MKKSKKILALMLALVLTMSMMTACGSGDDKKAAESQGETDKKDDADTGDTKTDEPAEAEEVTLNTVTMMGGEDPNTDNYNKLIEKFQADHPNVTIEDNSQVADNDWKIQIEADFSMGNEPDVIQYYTDKTAENILKTDKFVTLDEMKAENPEIAKNTSDIALEQTKSPVDGKNYAVPTTGYWEGLYCNEKLFKDNGLELPTDWAKLETAIKTFKEKDIIPIAIALNDVPNYWIEFLMMTASTTEEFVQIPDKAPKSWVEGLSKMKELYDLGAFSKDVATVDNEMAQNTFKEGKSAMILEGSWFLNGIPAPVKDTTVVCAFPKWDGAKVEEGTAISGYSSGFYITKKAWEDPAKRKAALDFVLANTCDEQILTYWGGNGASSVPVPEGGDFNALQLSGAKYAETITNPVAPTDSRMTPEAFNGLKDNMVAIATGKMSPEDGINTMLKINGQK